MRRLIVDGDGFGFGRDAFDEAGEDLAGADFDEGVDALRRSCVSTARDPVDAAGQVLDELGAALLAGGQRPRVGVGQQRRARVVEFDVREDARASRPPRAP